MKVQWLTNFAYVLLGMLLFSFYEHGMPSAALFIHKKDFASSLIACRLAKSHADRLAKIEPASPLGRELHKTSLIDLMTCESYQSIRTKLIAAGVSEPRLKTLEVDALSRSPELIAQTDDNLPSQ